MTERVNVQKNKAGTWTAWVVDGPWANGRTKYDALGRLFADAHVFFNCELRGMNEKKEKEKDNDNRGDCEDS